MLVLKSSRAGEDGTSAWARKVIKACHCTLVEVVDLDQQRDDDEDEAE
jgi:hypothetical protein